MFVPTMIFGHLLTSSNYNDEEEKVTGGRNGFGAKLCNIFSTKFTVETASKEYKRKFKQVCLDTFYSLNDTFLVTECQYTFALCFQSWTTNMTKTTAPAIKDSSDDYTKITFSPDLAKFKMEKLDKDIVDLMSRRAYDVAASSKGVKVFLNDKRLPVILYLNFAQKKAHFLALYPLFTRIFFSQIKSFKDYIGLYTKDKQDEDGQPLKIFHESPNPRWEIGLTSSELGFRQVSFVNSIATTKVRETFSRLKYQFNILWFPRTMNS